MNSIDRAGTFRGVPTDWGVSESKGGFPQFVVKLLAQEMYDETENVWMPWSEYEMEITAYLILYTKDKNTGEWKELAKANQIKKALGWNGQSFADLANGDYSTKRILFCIDLNEFNGSSRLQVNWIDAFDADPVRKLAKFDTDKLKGLDAAFAGVMKATPTPTKAAKPATGKPAVPPKGGKPKATKPADPTPVAEQPPVESATAATEETTAQASAPAPVAPPKKTTPPPAAKAPAGCTKDEAWAGAYSNELRDVEVTDDKLGEIWIEEVTKLGAEDDIDVAGWASIRKAVIDRASKF